jgi:formylglycine-generating enzyme required for sulfatase activity
MVVIPAGSFEMGSTEAEIDAAMAGVPPNNGPFGMLWLFGMGDRQMANRFMHYELPRHTVTIGKRFALGRFPVTREEFGAFVKATGYRTGPCLIEIGPRPRAQPDRWYDPGYDQTDRDPAVCVTWEDAQAYIRWLNQTLTGHSDGPYRLPSEAEWEYAARAGSTTAYPWGDQPGVGNALCNGCIWPPQERPDSGTAPVGSFPPNAFGLFDMTGNVGEVTADCWHANYIGAPTDGSPWLETDCQRRTERGSSWRGLPWTARSAKRSGYSEWETIFDRGFRVAKELK